jgi:hypothetical protein
VAPAQAACLRVAAWAAWISDPATQAISKECKTPAAMPGFLFERTVRTASPAQ